MRYGRLGTGTVRSQEAYAFENCGLLPIRDQLGDGAQSLQMQLMPREMRVIFPAVGFAGKVTSQQG